MLDKPHERGVTLLELLVAIALFAAASLVATLFLTQTLSSADRLEQKNETLISIQTGLTLLEQDLTQLQRRGYKADAAPKNDSRQPMLLAYGEGQPLVMQFIRSGNAFAQVKPMLVRYQIVAGQLLRATHSSVDGASVDDWNVVVLINDITTLQVDTYFKGAWRKGWSDLDINREEAELPAAIRLTLLHTHFGLIEKTVHLPRGL